MRKKLLQRCFLTFLVTFSLTSCGTAPKGPVCVIDVANQGAWCADNGTGEEFFLPFAEADNDILMPQEYAFELFRYCKRKSTGRSAKLREDRDEFRAYISAIRRGE